MIRNTPVVLENPGDLDARSELLWASTLGCNGIAALGSQASGWPCHAIEHDITHGIGLAFLTSRLLRYFLEKAPEFLDRFAGFAERVEKHWFAPLEAFPVPFTR